MKRSQPSRAASKKFQDPGVVFQPAVSQGMKAGIDRLVGVIAPTLGPLPKLVANEKIGVRNALPEILDSGGTIARRIIQVPERVQDVGLMYLRHILWKQQETEGDGTATIAVMFQTLYHLGLRYIAAGGNPMALRRHLDDGLRLILAELDRQTVMLHGKTRLAGLARTICYEAELAKMLGEIFDIIGAYGRLEIRKGVGQELVREYVEGMYWDSPLRSREMGNAEYGRRANFENPAILISDLEIDQPEQLVPLLTLALKNDLKQVLLVSATLSEKAMAILLAKPNREKVHVAAVKIPGLTTSSQQDTLDDLAILTGGRALRKATGDRLETVRLEDLGRARRVWADTTAFGIIGGRGDPRELRSHMARLRKAFTNVTDPEDRKRLLERLGKLMGGSATLHVGGYSPSDIEARLALANRTAAALRGAMREGVVPGAGMALLHCQAALEPCLRAANDPDERAAYRMLSEALQAPFYTLAKNAGYQPGKLLAEVQQAGPGAGFDCLSRQVVELSTAGLYDSASVVKAAVRAAVGGAALGLTTDAIIHRKNPPESMDT